MGAIQLNKIVNILKRSGVYGFNYYVSFLKNIFMFVPIILEEEDTMKKCGLALEPPTYSIAEDNSGN